MGSARCHAKSIVIMFFRPVMLNPLHFGRKPSGPASHGESRGLPLGLQLLPGRIHEPCSSQRFFWFVFGYPDVQIPRRFCDLHPDYNRGTLC